MKSIFLIIPCYNEEGNIKKLLDEINEVLDYSVYNWQVVVVNDCSSDNTYKIASETKKIVVLNLPLNLGVGGAVQTGFIYAKKKNADYVIKIDGDGQHNPKDINKLITPIIDGKADIIIGSRFLTVNDGFKTSFFRKIGILFLQLACKILTSQKITDPTSGFRAYNKKALAFMAENYPCFDYPEPEEVVLANENDLNIVEVPVKMREREKGKSSISFYVSFYYMIKVIISMVFIKMRK